MLTIRSLTVRYGAAAVVDDVSLAVSPGRWLGLIGPNGAGKSTLLRAIAALAACEGAVRIDGALTRGLSRREMARLVAYVPQSPEWPAGMTVMEYVLLGRTAHIGYFGTESVADRRHCAQLMDRLGIGRLAGRMLVTLSGGERQRAVLARALAQQAPVLLLDEPTSALDLGNRGRALEIVDEMRLERGLTVVSAIHDLTLAAQFVDSLALMVSGRLVTAGPPEAVLTDGVLSAHFGGDVRVIRDESGLLVVAPVRPGRPVHPGHATLPPLRAVGG